MAKRTLNARGEKGDKHDGEIAAIRTLIKAGMKMIVDGQREMKEIRREFRREMSELRQAQRRTEQTLERLIRSLRFSKGQRSETGSYN